MSKQRPCACGARKRLNEFGLTDDEGIRHTWEECELLIHEVYDNLTHTWHELLIHEGNE